MGSESSSSQLTPRVSLLELAKVFLVIGTIGFGGGMAIVALIQDYVVTKRKWMDLDEYTHGVALGQVMGAFAVNITIFVGYRIRGLKGAIVAATTFLAPSIVLVIALTALYTRFHNVQSFQYALKGIAPVVVAIILAAAYQMGKPKVKSLESIILMVAAVLLVGVLKVQIVFVLLGAAAYALVKLRWIKKAASNENV
jgi:chromate transporter